MILYAIKRYLKKPRPPYATASVWEESWYCGVSPQLWSSYHYARTLLPKTHAKAVIRCLRAETGLDGAAPDDPRYVLVKVRL